MAGRLTRLETWTRQRFGVTDIAYWWAAQDNTSTDGVPYVGPLHVGAEHVAARFGGWVWGATSG